MKRQCDLNTQVVNLKDFATKSIKVVDEKENRITLSSSLSLSTPFVAGGGSTSSLSYTAITLDFSIYNSSISEIIIEKPDYIKELEFNKRTFELDPHNIENKEKLSMSYINALTNEAEKNYVNVNYYKEAVKLGTTLEIIGSYTFLLGIAYNTVGRNFVESEDYIKAIEHFIEADKLDPKQFPPSYLADQYLNIANKIMNLIVEESWEDYVKNKYNEISFDHCIEALNYYLQVFKLANHSTTESIEIRNESINKLSHFYPLFINKLARVTELTSIVDADALLEISQIILKNESIYKKLGINIEEFIEKNTVFLKLFEGLVEAGYKPLLAGVSVTLADYTSIMEGVPGVKEMPSNIISLINSYFETISNDRICSLLKSNPVIATFSTNDIEIIASYIHLPEKVLMIGEPSFDIAEID